MRRSFLGAVSVGTLLAFAAFQAFPVYAKDKPSKTDKTEAAAKNPPVKLRLDESPFQRQGNLAQSFAPIIKKAAPSVVAVFSSRTVQEQDPRNNPLFNNPMFRRFFDIPEDEEDEAQPRSRRRRSHQEMGLGSGVIVTEDGYIITNNHVVEGADDVKVETPGGTRYAARVIGTDTATDTAILKIDADKLPAITIGTSEGLEVGDVVLAIGNPFGIGQTVTMGIISGLGRTDLGILGFNGYEDFIQTDAAINMGNSGGALIDAQGRLIGINTAILSRTGGNVGVGFAIPIDMARNVVQSLTTSGKVSRGFLGIGIQPVTPELARQFKLPAPTGALVGGFAEGKSPAREAGIKPGDVIIEFNGKKIADDRHLRLTVSQTPPNTESTVKVIRDGSEKTFKIKLAELPSDELAAQGDDGKPGDRAKNEESLEGVTVDDLDVRTRRQFNIPSHVEGAIVTDVDPDSKSYEAGLRPGDVIMEINRKPVSGAKEAVDLSEKAKGPETLLRIYSRGNARFLSVENGVNESQKLDKPRSDREPR